MKDKVQAIDFHIKIRGVQGLVFVQIMFEKCTTNVSFEKGEVGIKTTIANFSMGRFRMFKYFYPALFSIKTCFYETKNVFYLEY